MKSVRVVVPLAIGKLKTVCQFVIEVFVKTAFAKPALPTRFRHTNKFFFNLAIAFRADILHLLVLSVLYSVSALVCVIARPTMSASISVAVRLIDHWPLPSCAALLEVVP